MLANPGRAVLRPQRMRKLALAGMLAMIASLAGCSGVGLSPPSLSTATSTEETGASAGTADQMQGNPFHDNAALSLAGRTVIPNPSVEEIMKPASGMAEMALGRPDAPVTFIKYASMTCPYCRQFQIEVFPELKRQYIDTGKVRFILREFPIGFQSGSATVALRCVPAERYFQAYDKLMRQQSVWVSQEVRVEPILKVVGEVGLTAEQFGACRQNQGMIRDLNSIKERGRTLGIVGTPNFFINGKLIKNSLTLRDVKAIIDPILTGGSTSPAPRS